MQVEYVSKNNVAKYFKFFTKLLDVYYCKKEIGWKD